MEDRNRIATTISKSTTDTAGRFDSNGFRRALGQFATGVAVVTGLARNGECFGMTVSSFNSVSLDPPLVLFSIGRTAKSLPAMLGLDGFVVNILRRSQRHVSTRFAIAGADKWSSVDHRRGQTGGPVLDGGLAHFECVPYAHHDGGDHVIFVGRVVSFSWTEAEAPLLFFRGGYCEIAGSAPAASGN